MQFENGLSASFQVTGVGTAIIHEQPDLTPPPNDWDAPGPFDPNQSNRLVQTDQPFHVHTKFKVTGMLAGVLTGQWKAQLYFEKYGQGEAAPGVYEQKVNHVLSTNQTYDIAISVPGNDLTPGLYKMALVVTFIGASGSPLPISGFEEIGPINVYQG
ncbi:MAG: hypothetical protein AAF433_19145 [Bacteroidota bacterium]